MSEQTQKNAPLEAIIKNYLETEKSLVSQLNFQVPNHYPTIGGFREEIWKQLFEQLVPKKYVIEQSVFLMDSQGKVSSEVDLAIFDEMYTPYIFRHGRIKFIPIEAVAAVVQCKSTNVEEKVKSKDKSVNVQKNFGGDGKYVLEAWCDSTNQLKTSGESITRIADRISDGPAFAQNGTRPIKILCALKKPKDELMNEFDIYLIADKDQSADKIDIIIPHESDWTLDKWHKELNMRGGPPNPQFKDTKISKKLSDYEIKRDENNVSLLSLNLQLNQLLMLINNPMLFPHIAYAKMFQEAYKAMPEDKKS